MWLSSIAESKLVRFACTAILLMPAQRKRHRVKPSRKLLRRLELIESLPSHQQQTVLKTIDTMLRGLRSAS